MVSWMLGTAEDTQSGVCALPRMMTEVVPSPTSSSCVRLSSMMDCAHPRELQMRYS